MTTKYITAVMMGVFYALVLDVSSTLGITCHF